MAQPRFHGEPSSSNSVADPNVFSPEYIMYLRVWVACARELGSDGRWEAGVRKRVGARKRVCLIAGGAHEAVLILVLLVDRAHECGSWRKRVVDEDEDGLVGRNRDALADHVHKLADCQVHRDQVLALVDRRNVGAHVLFADDGNTVGVLLSDACGLCYALLEGMVLLVGELGLSHRYDGYRDCGADIEWDA